jgi:hypothetical protein
LVSNLCIGRHHQHYTFLLLLIVIVTACFKTKQHSESLSFPTSHSSYDCSDFVTTLS